MNLGEGIRPVVSPAGHTLAYVRANDHLTALHVRDLRTGADRRLLPSVTAMASGFTNQDQHPAFAFTPDGRAILISLEGKINGVDVATGARNVVPMRVRVSRNWRPPCGSSVAPEMGT